MEPLRRRSSSVSKTTFIATTVILVILLVAAVVAFIITFLRHIHRPEPVSLPLTPSNSRSFSRGNRAPPQQQQQQQPAPAQHPRPSHTRTSTPSLHATTHTSPSLAPARPLPPYTPNVPPASLANTRSAEALRRDALMARLAAMPLTSDTTDDNMGPDAPAREVVNRSYAEWVIKRRGADADPAAAMLIGSDEGTTDAGGGAGGGGYAALFARREEEGEEDDERSRRMGFGGTMGTERGGRRVFVEEEEDEELLTPKPLPVAIRKVRSDPYQ